MSEFTALSDNEFQSLMVLGKNELLYISVGGNNFDLFIMSGSCWSCIEYYVIGGRDSYQAVDDLEE